MQLPWPACTPLSLFAPDDYLSSGKPTCKKSPFGENPQHVKRDHLVPCSGTPWPALLQTRPQTEPECLEYIKVGYELLSLHILPSHDGLHGAARDRCRHGNAQRNMRNLSRHDGPFLPTKAALPSLRALKYYCSLCESLRLSQRCHRPVRDVRDEGVSV